MQHAKLTVSGEVGVCHCNVEILEFFSLNGSI